MPIFSGLSKERYGEDGPTHAPARWHGIIRAQAGYRKIDEHTVMSRDMSAGIGNLYCHFISVSGSEEHPHDGLYIVTNIPTDAKVGIPEFEAIERLVTEEIILKDTNRPQILVHDETPEDPRHTNVAACFKLLSRPDIQNGLLTFEIEPVLLDFFRTQGAPPGFSLQ